MRTKFKNQSAIGQFALLSSVAPLVAPMQVTLDGVFPTLEVGDAILLNRAFFTSVPGTALPQPASTSYLYEFGIGATISDSDLSAVTSLIQISGLMSLATKNGTPPYDFSLNGVAFGGGPVDFLSKNMLNDRYPSRRLSFYYNGVGGGESINLFGRFLYDVVSLTTSEQADLIQQYDQIILQ